MAMKLGQVVAFTGTMAALSVMSVVSVAIGFVCKNVPSLVQTSAPIGEYLGVALLLYFGFKSLKVRVCKSCAKVVQGAHACMGVFVGGWVCELVLSQHISAYTTTHTTHHNARTHTHTLTHAKTKTKK